MNENPSCPVCDGTDLECVGATTYSAGDMPKLDSYMQRKYRLLFEGWFPGLTKATFRSLLCRRCGCMLCSPRPSDEDLDRKYLLARSFGPHDHQTAVDDPGEQARAQSVFRSTAPHLSKPQSTILDLGGGDGRMLMPFVRAGHSCFTVDYILKTLEGVQRLGDTIRDIPPDRMFDAIVTCHVLEHVAEPVEQLKQLHARLSRGGILYAEVPLEIWKKPPPLSEPVTHINFYTRDSFRNLLQRAGFQPLSCRVRRIRYHQMNMFAICALGRRAEGPVKVDYQGDNPTRRLLWPPFALRARRALYAWDKIPGVLMKKLVGSRQQ